MLVGNAEITAHKKQIERNSAQFNIVGRKNLHIM